MRGIATIDGSDEISEFLYIAAVTVTPDRIADIDNLTDAHYRTRKTPSVVVQTNQTNSCISNSIQNLVTLNSAARFEPQHSVLMWFIT